MPSHRTTRCATTIANAIGVRPEVWIDLHENGGIFLDNHDGRGAIGYPGMTRGEIEAEFPTAVIGDAVGDGGWWNIAAGEEDWPTCQGRAIRVAQELWRWADNGVRGPVALVSHAGFMEALLKAMLDRLPAASLTIYHLNTAITRIDMGPGRELHVRYLNRVPHLTQDLVS